MLERLERTYFALFREYPPLLRLAVVAGAGQVAFALVNVYALPVYLVQNLHVSGIALGAASATFLACETLLKFPLGALSDRLGRKAFIVLGPLLIALNPTIVASLPGRLWALVFPLRVADGVGAAALWPPLFAMVGDLVHIRSRAAAMSAITSVYVVAIGVAVALGAAVAQATHSDRFPFYVASGLLLASAAVAHFGLPRSQRERRDPADAATAGAAAGVGADRERYKSPYPMPLVLLLSLLMMMGALTLAHFIVLYVEEQIRLEGLEIGALLLGLGAPVILLGLPLGHAADRWGKARAVRISLAGSAALMWLMPSCGTVWTFALVGGGLAIALVLGTPAWMAVVSDLAPTSRRGGVMGLVATAEGIGAVLGPLWGGWLWDLRPGYIFYGSAALLTLAAIVAAITLRREPHSHPPGE